MARPAAQRAINCYPMLVLGEHHFKPAEIESALSVRRRYLTRDIEPRAMGMPAVSIQTVKDRAVVQLGVNSPIRPHVVTVSSAAPRAVIACGGAGSTPHSWQKGLRVQQSPGWQDDQGKVWLTFNSGKYLQNYVYPRHGLPSNPAVAKAFDEFIKHAAEQATE